MKRRVVTLDEVREYMQDFDEDVGIMGLVEVENMGWCKDGVTRWYHFDLDEPCVYYMR